MSLEDLTLAYRRMEDFPHLRQFRGPTEEHVVGQAEQALGCVFPLTYRRFVRDLGWGNFNGAEFYGAPLVVLAGRGVPDVVDMTLQYRRDFDLPLNYILVYSRGISPFSYAVLHSKGMPQSDSPVYWWEPSEGIVDRHNIAASDFGNFFLNCVMEVIEHVQQFGP
jgi:antitoxin YobK